MTETKISLIRVTLRALWIIRGWENDNARSIANVLCKNAVARAEFPFLRGNLTKSVPLVCGVCDCVFVVCVCGCGCV